MLWKIAIKRVSIALAMFRKKIVMVGWKLVWVTRSGITPRIPMPGRVRAKVRIF
jgi:hypothetical protein